MKLFSAGTLLLVLLLAPSPGYAGSPWKLPPGSWKMKEGSLLVKIGAFNRVFVSDREKENPRELDATVLGSIRDEYWLRFSEPEEKKKEKSPDTSGPRADAQNGDSETDANEGAEKGNEGAADTGGDVFAGKLMNASRVLFLIRRNSLVLYVWISRSRVEILEFERGS